MAFLISFVNLKVENYIRIIKNGIVGGVTFRVVVLNLRSVACTNNSFSAWWDILWELVGAGRFSGEEQMDVLMENWSTLTLPALIIASILASLLGKVCGKITDQNPEEAEEDKEVNKEGNEKCKVR